MTDMENRLLNRKTEITILQLDFESEDNVSAKISNQKEYLDSDFEII